MNDQPMTQNEAKRLVDRIDDAKAVLTAFETLAIAASIRGEVGMVQVIKEAVPPAARVLASLEVRFEYSGFEVRHTSPLVRVVVPVDQPLHESLAKAGAVGEGALHDDDVPTGGAGFKSQPSNRQKSHQKPVTRQQKPVTKKLKPGK